MDRCHAWEGGPDQSPDPSVIWVSRLVAHWYGYAQQVVLEGPKRKDDGRGRNHEFRVLGKKGKGLMTLLIIVDLFTDNKYTISSKGTK